MKYPILLMLVISLSCTSKKVVTKSDPVGNIKQETTKPAFSISLNNLRHNYLYRDIENDLELNFHALDTTRWKFETDNGVLKVWGVGHQGLIKTTPSKAGYSNITVYDKSETGQINASTSFRLRVKELPTPSLILKTDTLERITRDSLENIESLNCNIPNFEYNIKFKIISFELEMIYDNKSIQVSCTGDQLNENAKSHISQLGPGDKVCFTKIHAIKEGNNSRIRVPSRCATIK